MAGHQPGSLSVSPEDMLAARCVLTSHESHTIMQGLTSKMEMCDYFVLYLAKPGQIIHGRNSCTTKADFSWKRFGFKRIPPESTGKPEEEL